MYTFSVLSHAFLPRPTWSDKNVQCQSRYLVNAAYMRLKNLQIGYTLPASLTNKIGINNCRLYISGENLLMWDKYEGGYSPEVNNDGKNSDYDYGSYPQARTITLGVNVTF